MVSHLLMYNRGDLSMLRRGHQIHRTSRDYLNRSARVSRGEHLRLVARYTFTLQGMIKQCDTSRMAATAAYSSKLLEIQSRGISTRADQPRSCSFYRSAVRCLCYQGQATVAHLLIISKDQSRLRFLRHRHVLRSHD